MAHNLDFSTGRAGMAFRGNRADIWHRMGQEMPEGQGVDAWAKAAGLDWTAIKVPAIVDLTGAEFQHLPVNGNKMPAMPDRRFVVRSNNGHALGYVSDGYQPVQPAEVLEWFQRYISVDDRFELDVAGSLKAGEIIWATAKFSGGMEVAGDAHTARLLMTTTFDGSGSTINKATTTRVVCNNTLDAALYDKKAIVRTRHSTRFQPDRVARELAAIASGFEQYKVMGDAMARAPMTPDEVRDLFKTLLEIPFEAKPDDISTRKMNQYKALGDALRTTRHERNAGPTQLDAWLALNAVTRWVDHERTSMNGDSGEKQFLSSQFGSGANVKAQAVDLLLPRIKSLVPA